MPSSPRDLVACLAASLAIACSQEPASPQPDGSTGAHDASVSLIDGSTPVIADASSGADGSIHSAWFCYLYTCSLSQLDICQQGIRCKKQK